MEFSLENRKLEESFVQNLVIIKMATSYPLPLKHLPQHPPRLPYQTHLQQKTNLRLITVIIGRLRTDQKLLPLQGI